MKKSTANKDFNKIQLALAEYARSDPSISFSFIWIFDGEAIVFISAGAGEIKYAVRERKSGAEGYAHKFRFNDTNEFQINFSRLEFLLGQILNLMLSDKPTVEGFIRTGMILQNLDFMSKIRYIKKFDKNAFVGVYETLKNLQELRNNVTHNPLPIGKYRSFSLQSEEGVKAMQEDFVNGFNHLVNLYREHQYKLLNFIKTEESNK